MTPPGLSEGEVDITVVVTCYNEEDLIVETLGNVTESLRKVGCSYQVIVIDDASHDHSVDKIREYVHGHPEIPIVFKANHQNRGLGNNYVEGAFLGRGKYYRLCCGDAAEPQEILVPLLQYIGKADLVIPYQNQKDVIGKSRLRKALSVTFTSLVNLIGGYKIKYYNGSAIHLRYNVMRWHPSSYGFGFQADMISRLLDEGGLIYSSSFVFHRSQGRRELGAHISTISISFCLLK